MLVDGWYSKKHRLRKIHACMVHHRFWLASSERLKVQNLKYKHKHSLDLDCFDTKWNVDNVFKIINIQYKIIIIDCMRGQHGKLSPFENQCQPQFCLGRQWFSWGDNFHYPVSDRNLQIWLAETNTICSDIMLPY